MDKTLSYVREYFEKIQDMSKNELSPKQKEFKKDGFAVLLGKQTQEKLRKRVSPPIYILTKGLDGSIRCNGEIITVEEANAMILKYEAK